MKRLFAACALCAVIGALVLGCSASPAEGEIAGADAARAGGLRALAGIAVPTPSGFDVGAQRTVDACGSLTSDRGGIDDRHIEGYSCAVVRRTVYLPSNGAASDAERAAAVVQIQEALGLTLDSDVPTAFGLSKADGMRVRTEVSMREPAAVDLDILPLWHANESIHTDDGELAPQLADIGEVSVVTVTTTVTYFTELR